MAEEAAASTTTNAKIAPADRLSTFRHLANIRNVKRNRNPWTTSPASAHWPTKVVWP
ncbi:hypothetical protein EMIT0158MI4_100033 [Burkholderia ambifaria]